MGRIKGLWRKVSDRAAVTLQQEELWTAVDDEIESLKARVKQLEDGATDDGK